MGEPGVARHGVGCSAGRDRGDRAVLQRIAAADGGPAGVRCVAADGGHDRGAGVVRHRSWAAQHDRRRDRGGRGVVDAGADLCAGRARRHRAAADRDAVESAVRRGGYGCGGRRRSCPARGRAHRQRAHPRRRRRLAAAGIGALLPYHYLEDSEAGGVGTGIYSRYPLRDTKNYDGFLLNNISAIMDHPDRGAIAVYAFHPVPPPLDFGRWQRELSAIRDILEVEQRPAIVGADFNATRDHSAFRELLRGRFESAADQAGAGPLRSYPQDRRWGPVIGIDHVLLADATADEVWTMVVPGTDHRAVLARTRLH
ncbi:endonuclease/exonuclease/phosphatase family protein [Nocardia cyriacigeorgica]|uniref:endonuclease/exonuclease/phosphatase family protein n=1 Tax=Nocardia cyriacigeorgica TaxID=135487 RepID=UPI00313D4D9E